MFAILAVLIHEIVPFTDQYVARTSFYPVREFFPEHEKLQSKWQEIRDEALANLAEATNAANVSKLLFGRINDGGKWRVFMLKYYNQTYPENLEKCPITASLLADLPHVKVAFFSIMDPGTYIPLHTGMFRGSLRYHLGLKIPQDRKNCFIEVDSHRYSWADGEDVLFDDTYPHYVWNNTQEQRVILFCDVVRKFGNRVIDRFNAAVQKTSIPNYFFENNRKQEQSHAIEE